MTAKELLKDIKSLLKKNPPAWCSKIETKGDLFKFIVNDEKDFLIGLSTAHPERGITELNISLAINNTEVYNIINESKIDFNKKNSLIFFSGRWNILPSKNTDDYFFSDNADISQVSKRVFDDIQKYYFSLAKDLTVNYKDGLSHFLDKDLLLGFREPFITAVIIAFFTKDETWIYKKLIPLTEKYRTVGENDKLERFASDFRKFSNPESEIIEPIRKWFKQNT